MRERRQNRLTDEFRDLVSECLEKESDRKALITITRVELLGEGKLARCYMSVFPVVSEKAALGFAERHAGVVREYISQKTKMRHVPKIQFVLDQGEKNRQRIDELLRK
ncbi:MAG TPA: ribosome-binding factor A [Candidatus Paceibacterota bacterium]